VSAPDSAAFTSDLGPEYTSVATGRGHNYLDCQRYRQHLLENLVLISCATRFIGVADLAAVRFSLPSQLLEPTPNLEYWNYLDSPNAFIAIGTADDPIDRMLEVLRFWFTKDLKYAKGRPCKPYNSCLGEFFRVCHLGLGMMGAENNG